MPRPVKVVSEFDVCLGRVVKSKRVKADLTRAGLAEATGIPEANLKRREAGDNEISTSELYRIAAAVRVPAVEIVDEALADYGGMVKLLKEHTTPASSNVIKMNVGGSRDIDLTTVPLHNTPLAASTDNTPIDPSRGEG